MPTTRDATVIRVDAWAGTRALRVDAWAGTGALRVGPRPSWHPTDRPCRPGA